MGLLLDTHTFIWYYTGDKQLSENALRLIKESEGDFQISIADIGYYPLIFHIYLNIKHCLFIIVTLLID
jgi:hypothetical protein